jgi:hypothetical protein
MTVLATLCAADVVELALRQGLGDVLRTVGDPSTFVVHDRPRSANRDTDFIDLVRERGHRYGCVIKGRWPSWTREGVVMHLGFYYDLVFCAPFDDAALSEYELSALRDDAGRVLSTVEAVHIAADTVLGVPAYDALPIVLASSDEGNTYCQAITPMQIVVDRGLEIVGHAQTFRYGLEVRGCVC